MDAGGRVVSSGTEEHRPFASPQPGWAEQDPRVRRRACGIAVKKALQKSGLRAEQIACVGFSGQMHGAVMLDASGEVVRPALIWCDQRTEKQSRELSAKIWPRTADSADVQSSVDEFHFDEAAVGARERAAALGTRALRDAAERLRAVSADGRPRD